MNAPSTRVKLVSKAHPFVEHLLLPILGVLVIFSAYSNTLTCPPVLDDYHSFIYEHQVHVSELNVSNMISLTKTKFGWARWIPMITLTLNMTLGKGELMSFHLTNIIIHILAFLGVYFLTSQLLALQRETNPSHFNIPFPRHLPLLIACLWALQPVQTNAVTYIVQRMASIQTVFFVTCVTLYIKGRRAQSQTDHSQTRATLFFVGSGLAALCAFVSKQNSVMLPIMVVATEMWFFRTDLPSTIWNWLRSRRVRTYIFLALAGMVVFFLASMAFQSIVAKYSTRHFTLIERLLTEARVVVWYMSILIWPLPSRLAFDHDIVLSTSLFNPPTTFLSLAFIILLTILIFRYRRKFALITYGMLWFFVESCGRVHIYIFRIDFRT